MSKTESLPSFLGLSMVYRTVWTHSRCAVMFVIDCWQEDLLDTRQSKDSGC